MIGTKIQYRKWKPLWVIQVESDLTWDIAAAAAKSLQSCLTLCDPIDGSPPGSAIPGVLQARTLERVAISFSRRRNIRGVKLPKELEEWTSQAQHWTVEFKDIQTTVAALPTSGGPVADTTAKSSPSHNLTC